MIVSALKLELRLVGCPNAREKRRRMRAIIDKLREHFNVTAAEVDRLDRPDETVLAVVTVAAARREAREVLERVLDAVAAHPRADLIAQSLIEV